MEQVAARAKEQATDLQNEFQKGKKAGEDAEKAKNMQEKEAADKRNDEHMQKVQREHLEAKQVRLRDELCRVCLPMRLRHRGL